MNNKENLIKILTAGLTIFIGLLLQKLVSPRVSNSEWLVILVGYISMCIIYETLRALSGQEITWTNLTKSDKKTVFSSLAVLLIFFLYPIKEKLSMGITVISASIGFIFASLLIYTYGSEELKKRYSVLRPKI